MVVSGEYQPYSHLTAFFIDSRFTFDVGRFTISPYLSLRSSARMRLCMIEIE
jgi:hypothetical protein